MNTSRIESTRMAGASAASGTSAALRVVIAAIGLIAATFSGTPANAAGPDVFGERAPGAAAALAPSSFFIQAGAAEEAQMLIVGATWDWSWYKDLSIGRLGGYLEASFGRWNSDGEPRGGSAWVTQIGVTPVLRLYPDSWGGSWFVEGGIGANWLLPVYQSKTKRFSTTFNFGDHLAVGRRFGRGGKHELALRLQHFSNAGIKEPNPGENFLQIRYSWGF